MDNKTAYEKILIAAYFAITSLTTTGFGDFYPVNNTERLIYSFIMLFGITIFAFFIQEIQKMFFIITNIEGIYNGDKSVSQFFVLMMKFNYGFQINA